MFAEDAVPGPAPERSPGVDPGPGDPDDGESPEAALRRMINQLDARNVWAFVGGRSPRWGMAGVCRIRPGRVLHVVGASAMAERLRELLAAQAAPGWELHPLPPGQTPLHLLVEPLLAVSASHRFYNLLDRSGFATVEEVAATPDDCLLGLYQGGPKMVAAVRLVLRDLGWDTPALSRPSAADLAVERWTHIGSRMAEAQRVRYREFAGMLARSSMPLAALDKIIESLNAEVVPPADPLVCLLLETAGEAEMASYYQRTHAQPSANPDSR